MEAAHIEVAARVAVLERQMGNVQHRLEMLEAHRHDDIGKQISRLTDAVTAGFANVVAQLKSMDPLNRPGGMVVSHGPTNLSPPTESRPMAKQKFTASFAPKGAMKAGAAAPKKLAAGDPLPGTAFTLQSGTNDDVTVTITNQAGQPIDVSAVSTLTPSSDNPCVVVGPPTGGPPALFNEKAVSTGTANITLTLHSTANPPAWPDLVMTYPDTCTADPNAPGGFIVNHGAVSVN